MNEHAVRGRGRSAFEFLVSGHVVAPRLAGTSSRRAQTHRSSGPVRPSPGPLSPFARGFAVTWGAIVAIGLALALVIMSGVVFNVFAALFIALSLNPLVNVLGRRGLSRGRAILVVAVAFALLAGGTLVLVIPPRPEARCRAGALPARQPGRAVEPGVGANGERGNEWWSRRTDPGAR